MYHLNIANILLPVINEELPPHTFIADAKILLTRYQKLNEWSNTAPNYFIYKKSSTISKFIYISKLNGSIYTQIQIDRDIICDSYSVCCPNTKSEIDNNQLICNIDFLIKVIYRNNHVEFYKFILQIADINDNSPSFLQTNYQIYLNENTPPTQIGTLPCAIDKDIGINAQISYRLAGNSTVIKYFSLTVTRDKLLLKSHVTFDREIIQNLKFQLLAQDISNKPAILNIEVVIRDVNDNSPIFDLDSKFSPYFSIYENSKIGEMIHQFNIIDKDVGENAMIKFQLIPRIKDDEAVLPFGIKDGGLLYISGIIDREKQEKYFINVVVSDIGSPPRSSSLEIQITVLDVNDNSPEFFVQNESKFNQLGVLENSPIYSLIATVEITDKDQGQNAVVDCKIRKKNRNYVRLEEMKDVKIYSVKTTESLDREVIEEFTEVIECWDFGNIARTSSVSLTIQVYDQNDCQPRFKPGVNTFEVKENSALLSFVAQIYAFDDDIGRNGEVLYSLTKIDNSSISEFVIDQNSGIIRTYQIFDREVIDQYVLVVIARDRGTVPLSASISVTVVIGDLNDNSPVFKHTNPMYLSVSENFIPEVPLVKFNVSDKDLGANGQVEFILTDHTFFFQVSQKGELLLINSLDRERTQTYQVPITARDKSSLAPLSSQLIVIVTVTDVNDNAPKFIFPPPHFHRNISCDFTVGRDILTKVIVTDPDSGTNARVSFSTRESPSHFIAQQQQPHFSVVQEKGEIILINPLRDLCLTSMELVVIAHDSGTPPLSSSVTISLFIDQQDPSDKSQTSHFFNRENDIYNASMIIIGCISIIVITLMVATLAVLVHRNDGRFLGHSWSGRNRHNRHNQSHSTMTTAPSNSLYQDSATINNHNSLLKEMESTAMSQISKMTTMSPVTDELLPQESMYCAQFSPAAVATQLSGKSDETGYHTMTRAPLQCYLVGLTSEPSSSSTDLHSTTYFSPGTPLSLHTHYQNLPPPTSKGGSVSMDTPCGTPRSHNQQRPRVSIDTCQQTITTTTNALSPTSHIKLDKLSINDSTSSNNVGVTILLADSPSIV